MKKSLVRELIENSKYNKKVAGEPSAVKYDTDKSPNNHEDGKKTRKVDGTAGLGKAPTKKTIKQVNGSTTREKRTMTEGKVGDAIMGWLMKMHDPKFARHLYTDLKDNEPEMYSDLLDMFKGLIAQGAVTDRQQMTLLMNDPNAISLAHRLRDWASDKLPPEADDWAAKKLDKLGVDRVALEDGYDVEEGFLGKALKKLASSGKRAPLKYKTTDGMDTPVNTVDSSKPVNNVKSSKPVVDVQSSDPVLKLPASTPAAMTMKNTKSLNFENVSPSKPTAATSVVRGAEVEEGLIKWGSKKLTKPTRIEPTFGSTSTKVATPTPTPTSNPTSASAKVSKPAASTNAATSRFRINGPTELKRIAAGNAKAAAPRVGASQMRTNQTSVAKPKISSFSPSSMVSSGLTGATAGGAAAAAIASKDVDEGVVDILKGAGNAAKWVGNKIAGNKIAGNKAGSSTSKAPSNTKADFQKAFADDLARKNEIPIQSKGNVLPFNPPRNETFAEITEIFGKTSDVDEGLLGTAAKAIRKANKKLRPSGSMSGDVSSGLTGAAAAGTVAAGVNNSKPTDAAPKTSMRPPARPQVDEEELVNELFGRKDRRTPIHQRKDAFMTRKEKEEWEAGEDNRRRNRPSIKGNDRDVPKRSDNYKSIEGPDQHDHERRAAYEAVDESLSDLSEFLNTDMELDVGDIVETDVDEGIIGGAVKGIKKLITKKPAPTHDNVVDLGGKPVNVIPDTPHADSLRGAGKQAAKDVAALGAGGATAAGAYKYATSESIKKGKK